MHSEGLLAGLELMLAGMGTVFVFLTALVIATTLMSRLVQRYSPAPAPGRSGPGDDGEVVAAITAAIAQHRRRDER